MVTQVEQKWEHVEYHRRELVQTGGDAIVAAAVRNTVAAAIADGCHVVGKAITSWSAVPAAVVEEQSAVDPDLQREFFDPDPDVMASKVAAERERLREWWRGCQMLTVTVPVFAEPEEARRVALSEEAHVTLRREAVAVLRDAATATAVCGGVLRRHSFTPRDASWLRTGAIEEALCGDCQRTVTRAELLARAERENSYGTCPIDGDAYDMRGEGRARRLICPACVAAGRT